MTARRTHCPAGRPLYRYDDLPAERLATRTMLKRIRRRPAEGQEPVASYWTQHEYVPLYAVADSVPMAPLPPAAAAKYTAARTCVDCASTGHDPLEVWPDEVRRCLACGEVAAKAWWDARLAEARAETATWVAEVLADPVVIFGFEHTDPMWWELNRIHVEALDGTVLLHTTHWRAAGRVRQLVAEDRPDVVAAAAAAAHPADLVDQARALVGRRLIGPRREYPLSVLTGAMETVGLDQRMYVRHGDDIQQHLTTWAGQRNYRADHPYRHTWRQMHSYRWPDIAAMVLRRVELPDNPAEAVAFLRERLTEMAAAAATTGGEP